MYLVAALAFVSGLAAVLFLWLLLILFARNP